VRNRSLNLEPSQRLLAPQRVWRQAALPVIAGRLTNELFIRGCRRVAPGIGWRNCALENAGWR
jgi:hypothetical protein